MMGMKRVASIAAVFGMAAVGVMAMPHEANAWWRHGVWFAGPAVVYAPPPVYYAPRVYYAPPVVYAPPPVAYVAPGAVWIRPGWYGGVWRHGYWRR
jgi:hypothetical protein